MAHWPTCSAMRDRHSLAVWPLKSTQSNNQHFELTDQKTKSKVQRLSQLGKLDNSNNNYLHFKHLQLNGAIWSSECLFEAISILNILSLNVKVSVFTLTFSHVSLLMSVDAGQTYLYISLAVCQKIKYIRHRGDKKYNNWRHLFHYLICTRACLTYASKMRANS